MAQAMVQDVAMSDDLRLQIDLAELRRIFDRVLGHIEATHGSTVSLEGELFWSVPFPAIYDFDSTGNDSLDQPILTIGSLADSWELLQRSADPEGSISFEAVWLGDLLKAIGHSSVG